MKEFGESVRAFGEAALWAVFGHDWTTLDPERRRWVLQDFLEANDEGVSPAEYGRRIGFGNLRPYSDVMLVRARKGWGQG